eukprot:9628655-Lingulodinium_polyedra.AAC.1
MSGHMVLKHAYEDWYCKAPFELSSEASDALVTCFAVCARDAGVPPSGAFAVAPFAPRVPGAGIMASAAPT